MVRRHGVRIHNGPCFSRSSPPASQSATAPRIPRLAGPPITASATTGSVRAHGSAGVRSRAARTMKFWALLVFLFGSHSAFGQVETALWPSLSEDFKMGYASAAIEAFAMLAPPSSSTGIDASTTMEWLRHECIIEKGLTGAKLKRLLDGHMGASAQRDTEFLFQAAANVIDVYCGPYKTPLLDRQH